MREITYRAKFRRLGTGEEVWQYANIARGGVVVDPTDPGYVQVTDWEQFTGAKDKEGVDVFEGDIITIPGVDAAGVQVIYWDDERCGFVSKWDDGQSESLHGVSLFTVIGNIHDNCDLITNISQESVQ